MAVFSEDRVPYDGIEETFAELVELYGGAVTASRLRARDFTLPLRRGLSGGGAIECSITWTAEEDSAPSDPEPTTPARTAVVTVTCNRDLDAPKAQRILLLIAGVVGALMFMLWPFYPGEKQFGTLAWLGGVIAIAVYVMTLRKTTGGLAYDFLQKLAARQRAIAEG
jgi:hypothetical protein